MSWYEITHQLRTRHGNVVVSVPTDRSWHEITHFLRTGHGNISVSVPTGSS
jgi:hypothetical protein